MAAMGSSSGRGRVRVGDRRWAVGRRVTVVGQVVKAGGELAVDTGTAAPGPVGDDEEQRAGERGVEVGSGQAGGDLQDLERSPQRQARATAVSIGTLIPPR
jgi:hypothetical protein